VKREEGRGKREEGRGKSGLRKSKTAVTKNPDESGFFVSLKNCISV
jgi:hypothetical protein